MTDNKKLFKRELVILTTHPDGSMSIYDKFTPSELELITFGLNDSWGLIEKSEDVKALLKKLEGFSAIAPKTARL